jgi:FkbM family methyltransferase
MDFADNIRTMLNHPLNRANKVAALKRFLAWQIGSRLVPGPVVVSVAGEAKMIVSRGMTGATGNIYLGLQEFSDMSFVVHLLREGELFVDVGANVGSYTILAGALAKARCIAFEPIAETHAHLLANIRLNSLDCRAFNMGVGRTAAQLRFTTDKDTTNRVADAGDAQSTEVSIVALDSILADEVPVAIKIDVEGFETEVIEGARKVLDGPGLLAVVMETNGSGSRYGYDDATLHAAMLERGFLAYAYEPLTRHLTPLPNPASAGNTLYIRDFPRVVRRLESARQFRVLGQLV